MNNGKRPESIRYFRGVLAHLGQKSQTAQRKMSPVGRHFWRQWGRAERGEFFRRLERLSSGPQ
jgi:hypothetical protein